MKYYQFIIICHILGLLRPDYLAPSSYEFAIRGWLRAGQGINKPIYAPVELNSMMDDID